MDAGTIICVVAFALTGLLCIVLGRLGMAGKLDFNLGTYTRKNSTPESWHAAHQIMGRATVQSGWIQIAGGIAIGVFGLETELGYAGLTLAILGSLSPLLAMWKTFQTLERAEPENQA